MSTETTNTRVLFVERPEPGSDPGPQHFRLESDEASAPADGEVRVASIALGVDAFIKTTLSEEGFHQRSPLGGVVHCLGVGVVEESADPSLSVGDHVVGMLCAQTRPVMPARALTRVDTSVAPPAAHLGALGVSTGVTAFVGMREVGRPLPGETVVVSAAAGAVGSIAAQIAKLDGARVIGIAGGPEKCSILTDELGLDGAVDHRGDIAAQLRELAPNGVDVFFDNVGNPILDVVLDQIAERARVVICGAVAQYGKATVDGPSTYLRLAERYARMEGFTVMHFVDRYPEALAQLGAWLDAGDLVMKETVVEGIERFPEALADMYAGRNVGKLLVQI